MTRYLITILGNPPAQQGGFLKRTTYTIEDKPYERILFADALTTHFKPDVVRILGTSGSCWHELLIELNAEIMADERVSQLEQAVRSDTATQAMLNELTPLLNTLAPERKYELRLIPYGYDDNTQVSILKTMAEGFSTQDELLLDVTHGLRHLPMLALISAFYLRSVANVTVSGVYYAPYATGGAQTQAVSLTGLMHLYDWVRALECMNKDGDFGIFEPLLDKENMRGDLLKKAAFLERQAYTPAAKNTLDTFDKLPTPEGISAAAELFLPQLKKRIDWRIGPDRAEWEKRLARKYLDRRDYLRATQFAFESLITREVIKAGGNAHKFQTSRDEAKKRLTQLTLDQHLNPDDPHNFITLTHLGNSLAHGVRTYNPGSFVNSLLNNEDSMRKWLGNCLKPNL
ncbi:MAG: TIGR02221 family CRISPR-associated protein [Methylococcaceae bacterium]